MGSSTLRMYPSSMAMPMRALVTLLEEEWRTKTLSAS